MKTILLHPTYFPSIVQMAHIVQADKVVWETQDNFQKQTYRNRAYIAHSNGRLMLNVPLKHLRGQRQKTKEMIPDPSVNWQKQHFKSLQTAYRTSPFFEYYEDEIAFLFEEKVENLMNHNLKIFDFLADIIGFEIETASTTVYEHQPEILDLRYLVDAKSALNFTPQVYTQVLEDAHGFLPNLSVLDLLFNEGPNTLNFLRQQELNP